jgi:predicted ATPase
MLTIPSLRSLSRYGLALGFVAVRENDDKLLLTAVGQINHGGKEAVIDDEQAVVVANLNLDAGKKAMNMSDFFSAYSFFNHGISYLPRGHWNEHYDVSLELFNLAASCALRIAEYDRVKMLTGEIMFYAKCFEDQFRPISISITLLLFLSDVPEAMNQIRTTLSSLGEELPVVITQPVIEYHVKNTKVQLAGLSDDTLLSYPLMTTPSKIMAMELLSKQFANLTFVGDRASMPIVPLKMIQISLTYGMSPLSPVGFALYGNYLALARGDVEEGYRYVKFSLSLMKRLHSTAHESEILFYSTHTKVRVEPIQSSIEYYTDAYKAAMATGSTRSAIECSFLYDNCSFWSGKKLDVVVDSMNETMKQMNFYKHLVLLALILPIYRIALRLNGQPDTHEDDDLTNSFDETNNEDDITSKLPMHMLTTCFVKFYEGLVFREFDEARDYVQKYISIQSLTTVNMCNPGDFFRIL